jgi:hypothetical protein
MPRVGFEPTIPAFKRAKTFHALDRAANVIGTFNYSHKKIHIGCLPFRSVLSRNFLISVVILLQSNIFLHSQLDVNGSVQNPDVLSSVLHFCQPQISPVLLLDSARAKNANNLRKSTIISR